MSDRDVTPRLRDVVESTPDLRREVERIEPAGPADGVLVVDVFSRSLNRAMERAGLSHGIVVGKEMGRVGVYARVE